MEKDKNVNACPMNTTESEHVTTAAEDPSSTNEHVDEVGTMPRTYVKKTSRGILNEEQLEAAINAVKEGKSIREAGRTFGIAESTIRLRMKRMSLKLERKLKQEFDDYSYYYKPVDGEAYDENAALGGPPQIVVPEENGDTDVENSSNIFTYIPEAQFQTSEQDRTFVPETSFETCEQFIKIENNGRKKSNIRLLDQRQLENSEQRICTAIEELKDISASVRSAEKEDEFDIFGRSIAEQLRQLPLADALSIQLRLQTVVTEARLKATKTKARFENGVLDN